MVPTVLLVRPDGNRADADALAELGLSVLIDPYLEVRATPGPPAHRLLADLAAAGADGRPAWLLATSPRAIPSWSACVGADRLRAGVATAVARGLQAACPGARTAATLAEVGAPVTLIPDTGSASGLLQALAGRAPGTAILPLGDQALATLPDGLADLGWSVRTAVVYQTVPIGTAPPSAPGLARGDVDAILLRSPSAARAVLSHTRPAVGVAVVCAGATTAAEVRRLGCAVAAVARTPASPDAAAAVAMALGWGPAA